MNILQSIQQLDGEILLLIQRYLRTDMLTPFMKFVTFLGNGGWFWILCAVVLLAVPRQENRLCGSLIPDLRGDRYQPASQKYSGKTKAFCGNRSSHPYDHQTEGFLFPSGHTTASFAVALVMLRMLPKNSESRQ